MLIGFAITRHCNLRCPHCIRDDVSRVRSLEPSLVASVTDQARELFGDVRVSLTGGEPLLHDDFSDIVESFRARDVPWRITTNGWHLRRSLPVFEQYPPTTVRLSLSGGSRATHDDERGHGSWRRVLESVALCTSRRIPVWLSLVLDRRDRHEIRRAADLAEALGVNGIDFILPQPVPGSAARDSDLAPSEFAVVRDEVLALAAEPARRTRVKLDYGYPFDGPERPCDTFRLRQIYVDPEGRLCSCCQLSEYGANETEVVADLHTVSLAEAYARYEKHLARQMLATTPGGATGDPYMAFPCLRCAAIHGKLDWLQRFPASPWSGAADMELETVLDDAVRAVPA
ncbi:MAG: radical SAM protein [Gemmatimonadota bacterium]